MIGLASMTLDQYLARLASGDPTPGGGAAAALTAAQAAALLDMVVAVSGEAAFRERDLSKRLAAARQSFLALATADGVAFNAVMKAQQLPKATPSETATRTERVQTALKGAAAVPMQLLAELGALTPLLECVAEGAKPSIVSDVAVAAELHGAAIRSALHNIRINLKYIKDAAFNADTLGEATSRQAEHENRVAAVQRAVEARF